MATFYLDAHLLIHAVLLLISVLNEKSLVSAQTGKSCTTMTSCSLRANNPLAAPPSSPIEPKDCTICVAEKTLINAANLALNPSGPNPSYPTPPSNSKDRTNSIQDFCFFTNMFAAGALAPTPHFPGYAPDSCYPQPPATPGTISPATVSHSAGSNPSWAILQHLSTYHAQSFQPWDDLPFVNPWLLHSGGDGFLTLDPATHPNPLPSPNAGNPYFLEVSGIKVKGELLQNFLHFRIFANMSVTLGKQQAIRSNVLHGKIDKTAGKEVPHFARGRISAALIMVKDQDGWPIGDFSTPVPCSRTCSKYSHEVYYGDESNALPCSFTPPFASSHPGMFVFDVDPGRYCTKPAPNITTPPTAPLPNPPTDPRSSPNFARKEGVREVHATWSFGHNTCNFVEKIYVQTLIFEDVETVYKANIQGRSAASVFDKYVLFGWTAQYNILKTTRGTLGAPDYVNLQYLRDRDARAQEIDCHVPLFDSNDAVQSSFQKFSVPDHGAIAEIANSGGTGSEESKVPSRLSYLGMLSQMYVGTPAIRYFGQHAPNYPSATVTTGKMCRDLPYPLSISDGYDVKPVVDNPLRLSDFLLRNDVRCPCPALPSTLPPENRTADPARLHGRLIHASHMAIAYMFLTPIGCFVARYYKETFVTVFCFQEYWWYMWHVVTLIAACLFNVGAITSIYRKKSTELVYNENLFIHVVLGAISIFIFYMEIITGFFRVADPKRRMRQIFFHWMIGTLNNLCAVMSMFAMAWVDQSGFSCNVAVVVTIWLIFVIACYTVMEVNMRKIDKTMRLIPRRTYLPPPVKRLFTKEPPGRNFRLTMMAIFIFGLLIIQGFVSYFIWDVEGGASCEEEFRARSTKIGSFEDIEDDDAGDAGDGDDYS